MFFFPFCIIERIFKLNMNYSTLQEAYNLDSFEKIMKKKKIKSQENQKYSPSKGPANIETSKLTSSSESFPDYDEYMKKAGGTCAPIQAPTYTIPTSGECKKEFNKAMKVFTEENFNQSKDVDMSNMASSNDIMPYYDEDLEQYFDINNLNDEVKYNPNNKASVYMPNNNKVSYTNNNTNEYTNNATIFNNGNNLLNTSEYNLSPEERKKANEAIQYLKFLEGKIDSDERNAYALQLKKFNVTNPPEFYKADEKTKKLEREIEELKKREIILSKSIDENKKTQNNINLIINIFVILFIGCIIIFLCDYLVELSIQIGMKKTTNILEPYMHNKMYNQFQPHHSHQNVMPYNYNTMPINNIPPP